MFASCCQWLCLDSDVSQSDPEDRRPQSYTNSAFSSQPSPPEPTCKACGGRFDTRARKHLCVDCKKNYCGQCSAHQEPRPRLCHTCQRFYGNLLERAELMKLKVKELRDYLHLHEISTHLCREKEELVELILSQQSSPSSSSAPEMSSMSSPDYTPSFPDAPPTFTPPTEQPEAPPTQPPEAPPTEPEEQDPDEDQDGDQEEEEDQMWDGEEAAPSGRRASLSDLSCEDDIEALSVRQLKEILARNFVDYKGCCEKWELMERVTRLYRDQQNLQNLHNQHTQQNGPPSATSPEDNLCKICMDCPIDCVLLECGHMITCTKCGKRMNECPICRQYVIRAVHVFRS
ncbi:E3 ubiquitin-protein ligase rififylin [Salarias fasciatus]|uniref:E3 ubiquitin-protein ligase rififylin n=1 Tax=Salarias fasciatus TaxID=181472 RepID=UPI001176F431|nr:E3 ubiquitin-protein ligase rififylin-like [Salarias fasciatus]